MLAGGPLWLQLSHSASRVYAAHLSSLTHKKYQVLYENIYNVQKKRYLFINEAEIRLAALENSNWRRPVESPCYAHKIFLFKEKVIC